MASAEPAKRRCVVCHAVYSGGERFCSVDGGAVVDDSAGEPDPLIGQTLDGRYFVRRLLGRGGMGAVYEADHVGLDKRVAIKFLAYGNGDRDASARFRLEARAASRVIHDHVVQIFDIGSDAGRDFIVMEYLDGRDLRQELAGAGPIDAKRAAAIGRQMLLGLHAIHEAGIIHRDIKPSNVLLTTRGGDRDYVKIMDFGISKSLHVAETLTGTGNIVGTPQYMAPEQLAGGDADRRSDVYAAGLTLFAMLVGDAPFAGSTRAVAALHLNQPPPSLDDVRPGLPPRLVAAVERALAKAPDARFYDALEFAEALDGDDSGAKRPPRTDAAPTRSERKPAPRAGDIATARVGRSRPRWLWIAPVVIAAGVVGGFVAMRTTRSSPVTAVDATVADRPAHKEVVDAPPADPWASAPPHDAGTAALPAASPDAGAKPIASHHRPAKYCACLPNDSITHTRQSMCDRRVAPVCRCANDDQVLCGTMPANDGTCPRPINDRYLPGNTNDPCSGFAANGKAAAGKLDCIYPCPALVFRGVTGDPCQGYDRVNAARAAGYLDLCTDDPGGE